MSRYLFDRHFADPIFNTLAREDRKVEVSLSYSHCRALGVSKWGKFGLKFEFEIKLSDLIKLRAAFLHNSREYGARKGILILMKLSQLDKTLQ